MHLSGDCNKMKLVEVKERNPSLIEKLLCVWKSSVKEIHNIKQYVPKALCGVPILIVAECKNGNPIGFMGIDNQTLEMLFVANESRGQGIGRQLLQYGIENYSVCKLSVNEQNPLAKGFYERMGFTVYKRTQLDEQGNPYPLLYMKRD